MPKSELDNYLKNFQYLTENVIQKPTSFIHDFVASALVLDGSFHNDKVTVNVWHKSVRSSVGQRNTDFGLWPASFDKIC